MSRKSRPIGPDQPLRHADHARPTSRRAFIAQGFMTGAAMVTGGSIFSLFANPRAALAQLSPDLTALDCGISVQGAGKIPFICFDLAGGANIAGSNVLVGGVGGQQDFLTTAGYNRLGLPGDMIPPLNSLETTTGFNYNDDMGLLFHNDSAFLRGILDKAAAATLAGVNGAVIPARSENDTGNNPHNPMYAINRAGADGSLLTLIGSRSSDSGGNSMAPADLIDPGVRPTKIDRPSDVRGLVDTGQLVGLLSQDDAVKVMESIYRISDKKLGRVSTNISRDAVIKDLVRCGYIKAADLTQRFGNPAELDPELDADIVGETGIFSGEEFAGDGEFRKTASVMKLVMNGYAGAGTVTMGGYDYHTGDRAVGEVRDLRAGRCIGACLEYAKRVGMPLMVYVFSDGSVASNGMIDDSENGRGKGVWTGDNQSTAASFFLVYQPGGRPQLLGVDAEQQARRQQIGFFRADGSVDNASSPAANNVNLLVQTVALNYMALHHADPAAAISEFNQKFPGHGLGNASLMSSLIAFQNLVPGTIGA